MTDDNKATESPVPPQPGNTSKISVAAKKITNKVDQVKKGIRKIDWKAKAVFAANSLILLLILFLHGYSTLDNFRLETSVKYLCLLTSLITLLSSYKLFRSFGPGHAAVFGFSLFILPITISAIYFGGINDNGFVLANQKTGFWASATCLGTIVVMISWLYTRAIPAPVKHVLVIPMLYCSLGFLVGMFMAAPLDLVVLGTGFLQSIPFVAQPASLYLNFVLPLFLGITFLSALSSLIKQETKALPGLTAVGLFFLMPFIMGIATMNRYLIPNISFLITGKPVGIGFTKISYTSSWDTKEGGSRDHEIEIQTKDYKPGKPLSYEMNASLIPPASFGQKTGITLSVKDKRKGNDVLNLVARDFVVLEDGKKQDHTLSALLDRKSMKTMIVLCLDLSGSMSNAVADLKSAAKSFVENLRMGFEIEIIHFGGRVFLTTNGFTNDQKILSSAIDGLVAGGGTPMYDAVVQGFVELEKHPDSRGIMVVFSDGADTGSRNSLAATYDRIKDKGVTLFGIGLGSELVQSGGEKVLKEMASITGGKYFFAKDAGDLSKTFAQVLDFVSCQYTLTYQKELPPPPVIELINPKKGERFSRPFDIKAEVKGKVRQVDFFLDKIPVKSFIEQREGIFEHKKENPDDYETGKHKVIARVKDIFDREAEDSREILFIRQLPEVNIIEPAEDGIVWKDGTFKATVKGQFYKNVVFSVDGVEIKTFQAKGQQYEFPLYLINFKEGVHTFKVQAIMSDGSKAEAVSSFKVIAPKPGVKIVSPRDKDLVFGEVPIFIEAESGWPDATLRSVKLYCDDKEIEKFTAKPFAKSWNSEAISEGEHILKAVTENECGQIAENSITVILKKPKFFVSFLNFYPGQVIRTNTTGTLQIVNEQPETTIEKSELFLDGKLFKTMKSPPWEFLIDVLKISEGEHELRAETLRSDGKAFSTSIRFVIHPPKKLVLYFSTRDDKGKYLTTEAIKKLPLEVKEDRKKVRDFTLDSAADLPIHFGIIIDVSGSMSADRKLDKAKEAAIKFVDLMKDHDKAFLIKFSDSPELVQTLTPDRRKLQQEIEYFIPMRGTALYDSVFMGAKTAAESVERPALVLLTDGVDENAERTAPGSTRTLGEVADFARKQDVQIFTIGLGRELKMRNSRGEQVLKTISSQTGGSYFFAPTAAELELIFKSVIREVGGQSKLTFAPPSGANDRTWHSIEIAVPSRKDLNFVYKPTYFAK